MEFFKSLLALLTSFLQNLTQKKKVDIKLADATETAVVEKIRATENAVAVEQQQKTQEALDEVRAQHKEKRVEQSKKSLDKQLDDQFGDDQ